nr:GNAT family N-acetyltransferase [Gordonia soli]
MAAAPMVGDRVVIRYRLGTGTPSDWRGASRATLSDVTGRLVDDGDPLVVERDGTAESIPAAAVTSIRLLSGVTVRNSEIRSLEVAAANAWPGIESDRVAGWLVRSGGGFTRRANSAVPIEFGARPDGPTLDAIRSWYRDRGRSALVASVDRLLPAGGPGIGTPVSDEVQVLVRDLGAPEPVSGSHAVLLADEPTDHWLRAYRGPDVDLEISRAVVSAVADGSVTFATVTDQAGRVVAIGRGAVTLSQRGDPWLGITALWTSPDHRRTGAASAVMSALTTWGTGHGAPRAYVQVEGTNRVAGGWYRRLGFGLHHSYHYLSLPDQPVPDSQMSPDNPPRPDVEG